MTDTSQTAVSSSRVTFMLVFTTLLWGGSFVFNKLGFRDIPPVTFMFLRFALATLIMTVVCLPRLRRLDWRITWKGTVVGLALAATNLSFVLGLSGTTASRAGFLNNLFVLFIPLLCYLVWRERVDRWSFLGIVLALVGLWQLARGGVEGFSYGDFLSTVCALFIAIHIITVSKVLRDEDVYLISFVQFAVVALAGGAICLFMPSQPLRVGPLSAASLIYCAIFPTVICFTLQNRYQRYTTPTKAGLIYTLDPVWSMLGGMAVLGERLSGKEWVGCGFIFGAVALPMLIRRYREWRIGIDYRRA
ncbi:DMT family transporter [Geomobilimonas luticola]|uniref:DMT family transporter n=1 Tax=Geomobilimonas luticola TaxID=1114878 RepID=A0ABS5S8M8_9BACT|nr:DMT family transporter [Geomobilimonas luticola]MBT0651738.1 DMT family transporter [Geomobilimonas luticola]